MKEYIERAAVHDLVKILPKYHMFSYDRTEGMIGIHPDDVDFGVDKIPAADVVEARHGRWEMAPYNGVYDIRCSACGYCSGIRFYSSNYCPECGARMDKEVDHEAD